MFTRTKHALVQRERVEIDRTQWNYYVCRCGKEYFSFKHWGYASRAEAREQHREHLRMIDGT